MVDKKKKADDDTCEAAEPATEETNEPEAETATDEQEIDLGQLLFSLKTEHEKEKAVAAEYLRRLQTLQADYDNYRKRTQKEKEDLAKYASEKIIIDLLPVLDNLARGLNATNKTQDFEGLSKGMEMILRQLTGVLEKEGLAPIEAVGNEFDPLKHEAIMHVEVENSESNIVVDEVQKGYYLKEKVLRPSMVRVSM